LKIENIEVSTKTTTDIWGYVLVTDSGRSYEYVFPYHFKCLWSHSGEVMRRAIKIEVLSTFARVALGSYLEGDLLFDILEMEKPSRLYFRVGVLGGYQVEVELQR